MAKAPSYDFFGGKPVTIIFSSASAHFNGSAVADHTLATITPGVVRMPEQDGAARIDFHTRPLRVVLMLADLGTGGEGYAMIVYPDNTQIVVGYFTTADNNITMQHILPVGARLEVHRTAGSGKCEVAITATENLDIHNVP